MTHRRPLRLRGLGVLALGVAVVIGLAAWQPWQPTPTVDAAASGDGPLLGVADPLVIPTGARVLVFGDSWTYGSAATLPTDGYAYQLGRITGWDTTVLGVRGSGYLRPGRDGPDFGARMAALDPAADFDLIVVQGSINDRALVDDSYRAHVDAAWDALAAAHPEAQIVILGPAPHEFPVHKGTARIDGELARAAADRGWWYLSPLADDWVPRDRYEELIDVGAGRKHPSDAGHRHLAERLAAALLERAVTTEAGGATDDALLTPGR